MFSRENMRAEINMDGQDRQDKKLILYILHIDVLQKPAFRPELTPEALNPCDIHA